jgi:hypothetical protein
MPSTYHLRGLFISSYGDDLGLVYGIGFTTLYTVVNNDVSCWDEYLIPITHIYNLTHTYIYLYIYTYIHTYVDMYVDVYIQYKASHELA